MATKDAGVSYRVYSYDLINDGDSFSVNHVFPTDLVIKVKESTKDSTLLRKIFFKPRQYEVDNNCYNENVIYFIRKKDGAPACELRKI